MCVPRAKCTLLSAEISLLFIIMVVITWFLDYSVPIFSLLIEMTSIGTLPSLKRGLIQNKHFDLPEKFKFEDLQEKEVIGRGSYGIMYKARYHDKTVVVKNIMGESAEGEENFVKEAKLLRSLQHKNIVALKKFCNTPCAIMLEYVCFDFLPFEIPKQVSNLVDFLNYVDKIDGFKTFDKKLHFTICRDIAEGLGYLHQNETAHRDLKAKNILVSNQHYCHVTDDKERLAIYQHVPIICKLADFGKSRSMLIQTAEVHSTTKKVNR